LSTWLQVKKKSDIKMNGICRISFKGDAVKKGYLQRPRLAAGLEFEKRRARLQSPVLKIELEIILN